MYSSDKILELIIKAVIALLILLCAAFVYFSIKTQSKEAYNFSSNGVVYSINWKSKNHGAPSIVIKVKNEYINFSSSKIMLNHDNVKIGDKFKKERKSNFCLINEHRIKCVK